VSLPGRAELLIWNFLSVEKFHGTSSEAVERHVTVSTGLRKEAWYAAEAATVLI